VTRSRLDRPGFLRKRGNSVRIRIDVYVIVQRRYAKELYGKIRTARHDQIYVDEKARSQVHSHKIISGSWR
jgi:hypothetical protein